MEMPAHVGLIPLLRSKSYSADIIDAHPFDRLRAGSCKKRKDGAPPVLVVLAKSKARATAQNFTLDIDR